MIRDRIIIGGPEEAILHEVMPEVVDSDFDAEFFEVVTDLKETSLDWKDSLGLAANQIGHRARVFVLKFPIPKTNRHWVKEYVNPQIEFASPGLEEDVEGCGSIPDRHYYVSRPDAVQVKWQTVKGETQIGAYVGLTARAFQHELDHLNGVLISDIGIGVVSEGEKDAQDEIAAAS